MYRRTWLDDSSYIQIPESKNILWQEIIIHHSWTEDNQELSDTEAIRRYHTEHNGWRDIGYHFIIEYINGEPIVKLGRDLNTTGAHTKGRNDKGIGICIVGKYDDKYFSQDTMELLKKLCLVLMQEYPIGLRNIKPHSYYATYKSCPGHHFDWPAFILELAVKKI